jgi:hypothetical protein
VVEKSKNKFFDKVIEVARAENIENSKIDALIALKGEHQFKKIFEGINDIIPPSLIREGENPFTLLYRSLSEGLHDNDDESCLSRAQSIRILLEALADRLYVLLKHDEKLKSVIDALRKPTPKLMERLESSTKKVLQGENAATNNI